MLEINIPGHKTLQLHHLVLDYNGTIAFEGQLIEGVSEVISVLAERLTIHVLTADTHGTVQKEVQKLPCRLHILPQTRQDIGKLEYIEGLGAERCVTMGNGRNDRLMLKEAALGIAVMQKEGLAADAMMASDIVIPDIMAALNLLNFPKRLVATLRS